MSTELLKALLPAILIQALFQVAAIIDLVRHKNTRNLSPWIWAIIIILGEIIGALLYFFVGRDDS